MRFKTSLAAMALASSLYAEPRRDICDPSLIELCYEIATYCGHEESVVKLEEKLCKDYIKHEETKKDLPDIERILLALLAGTALAAGYTIYKKTEP